MLKDAKGNKPLHIDISEDQWKEMMQNIRDGILRKLNAARNMETIDKEIAAGLYVYAVEEFGKLLLLRKASSLNGTRRVIYGTPLRRKGQKILNRIYTISADDSDNTH
jgi:hypothetical protein